ncbi:MAG: GNAT family N-acetyltransferase [Muribaculaceae bacterium]|nr:GNAT family N-acetyltransferase [Muribaculaceae bacterium]
MHLKIRKPIARFMEPSRRLYIDAFPEEERRPWSTMLLAPHERLRGPYLHQLLLAKGCSDTFAGLVTTWHFDHFNYIEHFATMPALRGAGVGSYTLQSLIQGFDTPWVLEVERPAADNPMAARRIAFYERNGFHLLDYDYIQPPYAPGLPEVPLLLMSTDPHIDPHHVAQVLHREVYGK